jgi:AraC-like DNA-binding protein
MARFFLLPSVLMRLLALLPPHFANHVRRILPRTEIAFASTWDELSNSLRTGAFCIALIDPQTGGDNTATALRVVGHHPQAHIFAYVDPSPPSLQSIFKLSKCGLEDVFVHPVRTGDKRFLNAIENVSAESLASDVLAAIDLKQRTLSPRVMAAVFDLFRRPCRYQCSTDLAIEAGVSVRSIYRALNEADLGTPRRLITIAKVIHGYSYVVGSSATLREACDKLGYTEPKVFSAHLRQHMGAGLSSLRKAGSSGEHWLTLIEDLFKPGALRSEPLTGRLKNRAV